MLKNRNLKWLILLFALILLLAIPAYSWMKKDNHDRAQRRKSVLSPVMMVPGSSATVNRFDGLVAKLNRKHQHPHSLLKVTVSTTGKLSYQGSIKRGDNEPIIVVGFSDNHDGYRNIKRQAYWLNIAFKQISVTYKFNNFKAFGHSNGGLVWTYWLEHYYFAYRTEIKIKRLMTLASPFNFSESNLNHRTQMLADLIKYRRRLPKKLIVYSLTGGESYTSDGIVPEESVEAAKYVFQNHVKEFTQMTITGTAATHSDLPENRQVVSLIKQYLLAKHRPRVAVIKGNRKHQKRNLKIRIRKRK